MTTGERVTLLRKLPAAFAALILLTALAACGGDDDDDDAADATASASASQELADDEAPDDEAEDEMAEDGSDAAEGASNPTDEFCADFNEPDDGSDTPIEEVEASIDTAAAAQADAPSAEVVDAIQLLIDFGTYLVDNDDGDGVVTQAEVEAALAEFPTFEDGIAVIGEYCGA